MGERAAQKKPDGQHAERDGRQAHARPPARSPSADNHALQSLFSSGALRAKLRVGGAHDPGEAEADRMASEALQGGAPAKCGCAPGGVGCASCREEGTIRRKPKAGRAAPAGAIGNLGLGGGRRLGATERGFFEARMQSDFSAVRVHDDEAAARATGRLDARAFTLGNDIVFASGEYQPHSAGGRELLAHELAHVAQGDGQTVRRQLAEPEKKKAEDAAHPTVLDLNGTLDERKAAFKQLVKTTAVHRLLANQRNLKLWETLVQNAIPSGDLAALGLQQSGGTRPYFELQDIRDPGVRELRATQALGQNRACTGCHVENQLWGSKREREAQSFTRWASPNEIRTTQAFGNAPRSPFGGPGRFNFDFGKPMPSTYSPPAGSTEGKLNAALLDPAATGTSLMRIQPIVQALGAAGYNVLTTDILPLMLAGKSDAVRCRIIADIEHRHRDFGELITKIQAGEAGWEHFAPVIRNLLPVADGEVRAAIQKEMDDNAFWAKVEAVVVGILTVAALILTIFPPTSALGLGALAALDLTLAHYGINKGAEMVRVGEIYGLGTGADDVFTPEQQASADAMVLGGWVSMIGGVLQGVGGLARLNQISRMGPPALTSTGALALSSTGSVGRVVQQGDFVMTIAADGTMYVTVASRPDLVIMARGNSATLYQMMEGGGMRAVATASLPAEVATPAAAPLMLAAGTEASASSSALVPTQSSALMSMGAPTTSAAEFGPAASSSGRVLAAPGEPLQLGAGNPTTYTWDKISEMQQPNLWREREIYMQQVYGSPGQQHFPVPGTGGRFVDVPQQLPSGQLFAGEVKSYRAGWITIQGEAQQNAVPLSLKIEEQIRRDVFLRDTVPGYDPRWMFTDAPPTEALRQALRDAGIVFIEHVH